MNCPVCGTKATVIDTRQSEKYIKSTRRRYICYKCKKRFTTYEIFPSILADGEKAKELLKTINDYVREVQNAENNEHPVEIG